MDELIVKIETILEKPCYVIDILPKQVPADAKGNFFAVEEYLLSHERQFHLQDKFAWYYAKADVLLSCLCLCVWRW